MVKINLDSSCFGKDSECLEELIKICKNNNIILQVAPQTAKEILKPSLSMFKKIRNFFEYIKFLDEYPDSKELDDIVIRALKIHSSPDKRAEPDKIFESFLRRNSDAEIFAHHISNKGDFFVTNDESGFITDRRKEKFEKQFNTKVRLLNDDFIVELQSMPN